MWSTKAFRFEKKNKKKRVCSFFFVCVCVFINFKESSSYMTKTFFVFQFESEETKAFKFVYKTLLCVSAFSCSINNSSPNVPVTGHILQKI